MLLSNPVHVGEVNNTSNPPTRRISRRSKHLGQRSRIVQRYLTLPCPVGYVSYKNPFSQSRYNQQNHHMLFLRLAAILVCTTGRTHAPCSFLRPVRASLVLLHHVPPRSILSLPSRCTLAQCCLHPPLPVNRWHRRLDTKRLLLPRGNLTLALRCRLLPDLLGQVPLTIFSPTLPRYVGTRDPYPT